MSIQSIHPRKVLIAPIARERSIVRVQLLMPLAIVLPCKALATPRPLALERFLFIVRSHMTLMNVNRQ